MKWPWRKPDLTTCFAPECGSNEVYFPVVRFWAEDHPKLSHEPIVVKLDCPICPEHREEFLKDNMLSLYMEVKNNAERLGRAKPDWKSREIAWVKQ